jgi:adenosine 3'-phospho 5'-phosphosulfate transporter B3
VFYNSLVGFTILSFVTMLSGELLAAVHFCRLHPLILVRTIALTFVGYVGVSVYLVLVKTSGIVVATTVATVRKFCTILLSFLLFPKPFVLTHAVGLGSVFGGILLSVLASNRASNDDEDSTKN